MQSSYGNHGNFRYVLFMVIAMIAFAIEDAIIKQLALKLPISQVLISVGSSGLLVLYVLSIFKKDTVVHRRFIIRSPLKITACKGKLFNGSVFLSTLNRVGP